MVRFARGMPRDVVAWHHLEPDAETDWLAAPPPGTHAVMRRAVLPPVSSLRSGRDGLFGWALHRRAGLGVSSDGPVALGTTVVLGVPVGPLRLLAPCRVVSVRDAEGEVGFTYATLPGHPERGVEDFAFRVEGGRVVFELHAVGGPRFWGSRMLPAAERRVQDFYTDRYVEAGARLALGEL